MHRNDFTDPRDLKSNGGIVGPGGPHDRDAVVIDTRRALLPDSVMVAVFKEEIPSIGEAPYLALELEGRVNRTDDRVSLLVVVDPDGAAALVTEIIGAGGRDIVSRQREGGDLADSFGAQLRVCIDDRMEKLP